MSGGAHARPPGEGASGAGRTIAVWTGVIVGGAACLLGGLAVGVVSPIGSSASARTPSASPTPEVTPAASPSPTASSSPTPEATEPTPEPTSTQKRVRITAPGDPVYVTSVYPNGASEEQYGVGIVIKITFSAPVDPEMRAALERTARVKVDNPIGLASWSWPSDTTMYYRPKNFWPARTQVKLRTSWVKDGLADIDPDMTFEIGRDQTFVIRQATQMGKLYKDGELVRKIPVSLGKPTWETLSGVKTIMERYYVKRMVNPGPREPYDVNVPYALRITPSGEYLHAAPWNEYNLGLYATSHGCTNLSYDEGQWFYEHALEGDPVITKGTGVDIDWTEGPGAAWNIGWRQWKENAAALP